MDCKVCVRSVNSWRRLLCKHEKGRPATYSHRTDKSASLQLHAKSIALWCINRLDTLFSFAHAPNRTMRSINKALWKHERRNNDNSLVTLTELCLILIEMWSEYAALRDVKVISCHGSWELDTINRLKLDSTSAQALAIADSLIEFSSGHKPRNETNSLPVTGNDFKLAIRNLKSFYVLWWRSGIETRQKRRRPRTSLTIFKTFFDQNFWYLLALS